jgi:hypothetical protein
MSYAGPKRLKGFYSLKGLGLIHTAVGPAGLAVLKMMTGLQRLEIDDARITEAEVDELRRALPRAAILHPGPVP